MTTSKGATSGTVPDMAVPATPAPARLRPDEIARFHTDGLVVPGYWLPEDMVARMRASLAKLMAANPHVEADVLYGPHIAYNPGQRLRGGGRG